jgi:hypothetical protein
MLPLVALPSRYHTLSLTLQEHTPAVTLSAHTLISVVVIEFNLPPPQRWAGALATSCHNNMARAWQANGAGAANQGLVTHIPQRLPKQRRLLGSRCSLPAAKARDQQASRTHWWVQRGTPAVENGRCPAYDNQLPGLNSTLNVPHMVRMVE